MFWNYCRITNDLVEKRGNDLCQRGAPQLAQLSFDRQFLSDPNTLDPSLSSHEPDFEVIVSFPRYRRTKSITCRIMFDLRFYLAFCLWEMSNTQQLTLVAEAHMRFRWKSDSRSWQPRGKCRNCLKSSWGELFGRFWSPNCSLLTFSAMFQ